MKTIDITWKGKRIHMYTIQQLVKHLSIGTEGWMDVEDIEDLTQVTNRANYYILCGCPPSDLRVIQKVAEFTPSMTNIGTGE